MSKLNYHDTITFHSTVGVNKMARGKPRIGLGSALFLQSAEVSSVCLVRFAVMTKRHTANIKAEEDSVWGEAGTFHRWWHTTLSGSRPEQYLMYPGKLDNLGCYL